MSQSQRNSTVGIAKLFRQKCHRDLKEWNMVESDIRLILMDAASSNLARYHHGHGGTAKANPVTCLFHTLAMSSVLKAELMWYRYLKSVPSTWRIHGELIDGIRVTCLIIWLDFPNIHAKFGQIDASLSTRRVKRTRNMVGCADYPSTRKSLACNWCLAVRCPSGWRSPRSGGAILGHQSWLGSGGGSPGSPRAPQPCPSRHPRPNMDSGLLNYGIRGDELKRISNIRLI